MNTWLVLFCIFITAVLFTVANDYAYKDEEVHKLRREMKQVYKEGYIAGLSENICKVCDEDVISLDRPDIFIDAD